MRSAAFHFRGERQVALVVLVIAVLVMSCAGTPHGRSKDEWAKARVVAEEYLRTKYGTAWRIIEERPGLPFMFEIDVNDAAAVLVHDNAVFTQRGMAGFDRYLRGSRCVEQHMASLDDMLTLIHFFDAYAPESKREHYFTEGDREAWRPQLHYLDGGRATLTLYYRMDSERRDGDGGEGKSTESFLREWTLTMNPGQMPVWTSETRVWDSVKGQFRVDHTN